jgi:hypothetical protein
MPVYREISALEIAIELLFVGETNNGVEERALGARRPETGLDLGRLHR